MVYELFFSYYDQDPENDEEMIIAAMVSTPLQFGQCNWHACHGGL